MYLSTCACVLGRARVVRLDDSSLSLKWNADGAHCTWSVAREIRIGANRNFPFRALPPPSFSSYSPFRVIRNETTKYTSSLMNIRLKEIINTMFRFKLSTFNRNLFILPIIILYLHIETFVTRIKTFSSRNGVEKPLESEKLSSIPKRKTITYIYIYIFIDFIYDRLWNRRIVNTPKRWVFYLCVMDALTLSCAFKVRGRR